ncbi:MAG TPA: LssY C-terminal domain-containing protein [Microvirga sp.]|nr:LssY C-terminal domain-containing protein [Microvirga sp.]
MRRAIKKVLLVFFGAAGIWLAAAYLVLPRIWRDFEHQPGLEPKPMLTTTVQGIPGDPVNIGLVGTKSEVVRAFARAGWHPADPITLRTSAEIGVSVLLDRPYPDAPVSTLLYDGRAQDLAFEKPVGQSARRRHHARLWMVLDTGVEGRPVWLGSVSFDESVGFSHDTGQITHHIAPDLDAERDALMQDLATAGVVSSVYRVSGRGPTLTGRNGGGDRYFTDGEVSVGVIVPEEQLLPGSRVATPPAPIDAGAVRRLRTMLKRIAMF